MIAFFQSAVTPDLIASGLGWLVIGLGVVISWRALQGYRRNSSRPMLFFAIGIIFLTVLPSIIEMLVIPFVARYFVSTGRVVEYTIIGSRLSKALGIGILLYSLSIRR
jgi:hypothetical protein